MVEVSPVTWIQAETYQALDARLSQSALLGPSTASPTSLTRPGGIIPGFGGQLAVTQTTSPSLTVNVASGAASVPSSTTTGGNYVLVNPAPITLTHDAATSQARVDLILARVYDTGAAVDSMGTIEIYPGTAGAGVPAMPVGGNALKLAEVTVGPVATSAVVSQNNISPANRAFAVAAGGIQPATTTTRPANPYDGMAVWDSNTAALSIYSTTGSAWRSISTDTSGAWTTYVPAWTATTTNPVNGSAGSITGRYVKMGKTVHFTISLVVSGVGLSVGSGSYRLSLPPGLPVGSGRHVATAYWNDSDGGTGGLSTRKHWVGSAVLDPAATTTGSIYLAIADPTGTVDYDKGGTWGSGVPQGGPASADTMAISGTYETSA